MERKMLKQVQHDNDRIMNDCVFCKIRDRIIPKEFTYEDKDIMVFPDIHPLKPVHLLVVSKKHIEDFLETDDNIWTKMKNISQKIIREKGLNGKGYRLVVNGGGAQIVNHLHFHILGPMFKGGV